MSVKVDFNTNVKIACDNFSKAVVKNIYKNRYKIFKELIEENNKIMGGKKKGIIFKNKIFQSY